MRLLIVTFIILLLTSCATRKIMRNGVMVSYDKVLKEDYQRCERNYFEKRFEDAKECLYKFTKDFSDSNLIDDAHYLLGNIYYQENEFQKASEHFRKIITTYSFSDLISEVSFSLASCYYQMAEYKKSYIVLRKIDIDDVNKALKLKIYYLLGKNAQQLNASYASVQWYLKARDLSHRKDNISRITNEIIRLIEERLSKTELLTLADKYQNKFPSAYINYKLGKDFYDNLNPDQAKLYLGKFMKDKELSSLESHYVSDAGNLLARIESHEKMIKNRVGVILPLSGKFESYGYKALRGIQLAADIFNTKGTAFEIELVIVDSKNDPNVASEAVEKLLFQDNVAAIIGPLLSSTSPAVARACEKLGVPNISLSQKVGIPEIGEYTFRLALTNPLQVRTLAKYAVEKLGISKFAIINSNDEYGKEMRDLFWNEALKYGGEITEVESYEPNQTHFKNELYKITDRYWREARIDEINAIKTELEEKLGRKPRHKEVILPPNINFEAIFIPSFPKEIGQIAPSLSHSDIEVITLLGTNGWNSSSLIKRGGEYIEGAIFVDGFFSKSPYTVVRDFTSNFYNTYSMSPGIIEAHAYDAADIFINVLSQNNINNRSDIQKNLLRVANFPGVTGSITFSEIGEAEKPLFILTVENERIIQVN